MVRFQPNNEKGPSYNFALLWFTVRSRLFTNSYPGHRPGERSTPTTVLALIQDNAAHPQLSRLSPRTTQLSWLSPRTMQHIHNCPGYHPGQRNCPGYHPGQRSTPTTVPAITQDKAAHPQLSRLSPRTTQLSWLSPRTMQHTHNCPGYHPGQCSTPKIALVIIQESARHQIVLFIIQGSATHLQLSSSSFRVA